MRYLLKFKLNEICGMLQLVSEIDLNLTMNILYSNNWIMDKVAYFTLNINLN